MGNSGESDIDNDDDVFTEQIRKRNIASRSHSTRNTKKQVEFHRNVIRSESVTIDRRPSDVTKVYKPCDFECQEILGEGFFASATKVCSVL